MPPTPDDALNPADATDPTHTAELVDTPRRAPASDGPAAPQLAPGQPPVSFPPGAEVLTDDDAVHALVTGDHPDASQGDVALDAALVLGLRTGLLVACRLPNGQIAITRTTTNRIPPA